VGRWPIVAHDSEPRLTTTLLPLQSGAAVSAEDIFTDEPPSPIQPVPQPADSPPSPPVAVAAEVDLAPPTPCPMPVPQVEPPSPAAQEEPLLAEEEGHEALAQDAHPEQQQEGEEGEDPVLVPLPETPPTSTPQTPGQ
jgi:hypothetical protein